MFFNKFLIKYFHLLKGKSSRETEEIKEIHEFMLEKRKKNEEESIHKLLVEFLKQEKIRKNLEKLEENSKKLRKISIKKLDFNKNKPPFELSNESSRKTEKPLSNTDFDKNFSLIHEEYEKIMDCLRNKKKIEDLLESNGPNILKTAVFNQQSLGIEEK